MLQQTDMDSKSIYKEICEKEYVPLFMQPWWLDTVCKEWDVALTQKGDKVTGAWAYPIEKKIGVAIVRNPMLTPYTGPCIFFPDGIKESNRDSIEHDTVAELIKKLPDAKVWHMAMPPGMKQAGLFKSHGLQPEVQQTFLLALKDDEATLLANIKETARRNIKMAEKEITISNSPEHLEELFKFQKNTLERKGGTVPYTLKYVRQIMDACLAHQSSALWVASVEGQIQAVVWQVWDKRCSYYFMGGQNPEVTSYKAMTALLWHAIKEAKKRGQEIFDFEGSMDAGVERFFRNFGGERSLYMVLQKNDSSIWKTKQLIFR
jgi:hypothetical protein